MLPPSRFTIPPCEILRENVEPDSRVRTRRLTHRLREPPRPWFRPIPLSLARKTRECRKSYLQGGGGSEREKDRDCPGFVPHEPALYGVLCTDFGRILAGLRCRALDGVTDRIRKQPFHDRTEETVINM